MGVVVVMGIEGVVVAASVIEEGVVEASVIVVVVAVGSVTEEGLVTGGAVVGIIMIGIAGLNLIIIVADIMTM